MVMLLPGRFENDRINLYLDYPNRTTKPDKVVSKEETSTS